MKQHAVRAGKKAEVIVLSDFMLANHAAKEWKRTTRRRDICSGSGIIAKAAEANNETNKQNLLMHTHRHTT